MTGAAAERREPAGAIRTLREMPLATRALILGMFVNRLGSFLQVFLVLYVSSHGYTAREAGLALAAYGAGGIAGGLLGGWAADLVGSKATIVWSSVATAAGTIAVFHAPSYPMLLASVILTGALAQAYRPASAAMLAELTPSARYTMVFAVYRLATNLGTTGGPLLGALLYSVSLAAMFYVEALVLVAFAVAARLVLPASVASRAPKAEAEAVSEPTSGAFAIVRDTRFLLFLLGCCLISIVYVQYLAVLPLDVRDRGWSTGTYGVLVAMNGLIVALCEVPMTRFSQHWRPRTALLANAALIGAGMTLYGVHAGFAGLVVATAVWSFGETVGAPTMFSYPAHIAPPGLRGRYLGALSAVIGIAFAVGPAVGTASWSRFGGRVWLLTGVVTLAALAALAAGVRGGRIGQAEPADVDTAAALDAVSYDVVAAGAGASRPAEGVAGAEP